MIITTYGEYISKSTENVYQIVGQNDPATGERLWRKVLSIRRAEQSSNRQGIILYRGCTAYDVTCLTIITFIDHGKISVPEGVDEGDFAIQMAEKAAGKLNEYINSLIKEYPPKAGETL